MNRKYLSEFDITLMKRRFILFHDDVWEHMVYYELYIFFFYQLILHRATHDTFLSCYSCMNFC